MQKTSVVLPDGSVRSHFIQENGETLLYTGPIFGRVTTADGTEYVVNEDVVAVPADKPHHAGEVMHQIGIRHEEEGHPFHSSVVPPTATEEEREVAKLAEPFIHACDPTCGVLERSTTEILASYDAQLDRLGHGHLVGSSAHTERKRQIKAAHTERLKRLKAEAANNG